MRRVPSVSSGGRLQNCATVGLDTPEGILKLLLPQIATQAVQLERSFRTQLLSIMRGEKHVDVSRIVNIICDTARSVLENSVECEVRDSETGDNRG